MKRLFIFAVVTLAAFAVGYAGADVLVNGSVVPSAPASALLTPSVATGTADIDDSVQDESAGWVTLLTLAPATGAPMRDTVVALDVAKATTGYAALETSATIQFRVARKTDGTNWRGGDATTALSGTNAAGRNVELNVGTVGVSQGARIEIKMSADISADAEIPYTVSYGATAAPTVTPVAAG